MKKLKNILQEDCWTGYKQVGMKEKGGKQVPNCVPIKEEKQQYKPYMYSPVGFGCHVCLFYYEKDGKEKQIFTYLNGKKHGDYKSYYSNGQLKATAYYINDNIEGENNGWYEDGTNKFKSNYKNGKYTKKNNN